jgi:hypothetical protein
MIQDNIDVRIFDLAASRGGVELQQSRVARWTFRLNRSTPLTALHTLHSLSYTSKVACRATAPSIPSQLASAHSLSPRLSHTPHPRFRSLFGFTLAWFRLHHDTYYTNKLISCARRELSLPFSPNIRLSAHTTVDHRCYHLEYTCAPTVASRCRSDTSGSYNPTTQSFDHFRAGHEHSPSPHSLRIRIGPPNL